MYSPEIAEDLIPILYRIAKEKKRPMTKIVDEILREAIKEWPKEETGSAGNG